MRKTVIFALLMLATLTSCTSILNSLKAKTQHMEEAHVSPYVLLSLKYYYNVDGSVPNDHFLTVARILKKVAAGDGEFSPKEREAFFALYVAAGATDDILDQFDAIDVTTVDLDAELEEMKGDHEIALRHLIFASTAISAADGFHKKERALVEKVGHYLRVKQNVIDGIIAGTLRENEGRQQRLKFMGNQHF